MREQQSSDPGNDLVMGVTKPELKLIVQIPCYNEAETLAEVLAELPQSLPGIAHVETLVIDDGSTDGTAVVARDFGVDHIVVHSTNRGLAVAFQTGLEACLRAGADIIVNTDGDNQYPGHQIAALIEPIIGGHVDMVVGDRQTRNIHHFSPAKRFLQQLGSWIVRIASGTEVPDAASGFRALTRETALRLIVLTRYSYTLETIIQAGKKGLRVAHVPITVNQARRESRLFKSNWGYIRRQSATIVRIYTLYEPLRSFSLLALPFLAAGVLLLARFLYFYLRAEAGHVQSVVIGGTLLVLGFLLLVFGVMAELSATNRYLLEEILYRQRKQTLEQDQQQWPGHTEEPAEQGD